MKMEGRYQGRRIAYQSQSQIVYTPKFYLEKFRYASAGIIMGNKNKQYMTSQPV